MVETTATDWEKLHRSATVIDAHSDIPADVVRLRTEGEADVFGRVHLSKWRAGGVNGAVATVGGDQLTEPTPLAYATETIKFFEEDLQERPSDLALATSADSFMHNVEAGRVTFALGIEGSRPFEGSLDNLHLLYNSGVRFVTLTWSSDNEVGTGVGTKQESGLTDFGRTAVKAMASLGMVADISHVSESTFWDTIRLETGNVIASHSNAAALCPHPRNLADDQIKAVAEQDGFIGVCMYPDFLQGDPPGVNDVIDQVAYIGDLVGSEHVALGLDFFDFLPAEEAIPRLAKARAAPEDITYPSYAEGLEGIQKLPHLTEGMTQRGFTSNDIRGVLGSNLLRTWTRIGG